MACSGCCDGGVRAVCRGVALRHARVCRRAAWAVPPWCLEASWEGLPLHRKACRGGRCCCAEARTYHGAAAKAVLVWWWRSCAAVALVVVPVGTGVVL